MGKWDGAVKIARKSSNITVSSVTGSCALLTAALFLLGGTSLQNAAADGDTRTLTLHHIHTNEDITITYKRNGRYDEEALKKLNWFVRDWRKEEEIQMDPQLFDVIWEVSREVAGDKTIYVVCGYRSPATNAMLRARSNGVAEFSQHTLGKAMDFYIPGASLEEVRYAGLRLQRGGVGYYPTSGSPFVHLDVGSVRHWPRMSHDELARVFPNGRTVHVPSDDRPLPGYALALADIAKRGSSPPSQSSLGAARAVGAEPAAAATPPRKNALAASSKKGNDTSDAASGQPKASRQAPAAVAIANPAAQSPARSPALAAAVLPARSPDRGSTTDRLPSRVLAFAPQPSPAEPARAPLNQSAAPAQNVTVVYKKGSVRQAATTSVTAVTTHEVPAAQVAGAGMRYDDPWLRAAILAPSLSDAMTVTPHGEPDQISLRSLMSKPKTMVVMSFTHDPYPGITADRFSGDAVVFVSTTGFLRRTASLR
jgi:uncharacterized protein YcbK (DUF882 family)